MVYRFQVRARYPRSMLSLLIGFALGAIMAMLVLTTNEVCNKTDHDILQSIQGAQKDSTDVRSNLNEGWHEVHVYYGKRERMYKPGRQSPGSQVQQDKIMAKLITVYRALPGAIALSTPPYYIDLAANDAVHISNTILLENEGWQGLCIEPNPSYWYSLAHRKCAVAAALVGGKKDMQLMNVSLKGEFGGIVGNTMDNKPTKGQSYQQLFSISIKSLFRKFNVPKTVDYLSLDVEGAEELIMKYFPFDLHTILFSTIERPKPGLRRVLKNNGYVFVTDLSDFGETFWVHQKVLEAMDVQAIMKVITPISDFLKGRATKSGKKIKLSKAKPAVFDSL